jgi:hypothetical protein
MNRVLEKLPARFHKSAELLQDVGLADVAWSIEEADALLDWLKGVNLAILGGDIYRQRDGRLTPTGDSWHCDRYPTEPRSAYVARAWDVAWRYLQSYVRRPQQKLFVGFVLSDEETAGW